MTICRAFYAQSQGVVGSVRNGYLHQSEATSREKNQHALEKGGSEEKRQDGRQPLVRT